MPVSASPAAGTAPAFPLLLRNWRQRRRLSQLDLALDAGVSQRHLSFLESGRSRPSREMILQLSETLEIPLRERNDLLVAAGFAPLFRTRPLIAELAPHQDAETLRAAEDAALVPVLPLEIEKDGVRLSLFTVIATFGTAQDVTADELRIEFFFPADEATGQLLRAAASAAADDAVDRPNRD